ncbi:MAG: diadenylate cyclase CdaA [Thermoanaerobaculia bacterium]
MNLESWIALVTWRDILDIALVAIAVYYLLLLIRGTRAVQILLGILLIAGVNFLAERLQLATLDALLSNFLIILPFAVIVLFRQEIRKALARFGRNPWWGRPTDANVESTINDLVLAATTLAARRIGGLIVVQRLEGLGQAIDTGIEVDAAVSYDLLINIFTPGTPLHDGAVIIQQDRLAAASCFLPLALAPEVSKDFGTRHRAALGISEEADAVAIVVSEETGVISVAVDGNMERGLDAKNLRNSLYRHLITEINPSIPGVA